MSFVNDITKMLTKRSGLCLCVLAAVVVAIGLYSNQLGISRSHMQNSKSAPSSPDTHDQYVGESAPGGPMVNPAMPAGLNSSPGSAAGIHTITKGVPSNCLKQQVANPSDLLPGHGNGGWAAANSGGAGQLSHVNLLKAGHHSGIDTVGGTLRNANLQLRSEPPNPRAQVSPWSNSTIEPDLMRVPLELGCGSQ